MSRTRLLIVLGTLTGSGIARAESPASSDAPGVPAVHATGSWIELSVESRLALGSGAVTESVPQQHLVLGFQGDAYAFGIVGGFSHAPDSKWIVDLGPTARFTVAQTEDRTTELVFGAAVLATMGLDDHPMSDGGTTYYTFQAGLDARHWLDRHLAIGGGALAHLSTISEGMNSATDFGISGVLRVTGVF
jgi:hypothetical protein